ANIEHRGAAFISNLLKSPRWWAATIGDSCGYVLQAIALGVGSILVVQPLLIVSLVFALPIAARWNARPIHTTDIVWAVVIAGALAMFLIVGDPGDGRDTSPFRDWIPSIIACSALCLAGVGLMAAGGSRGRGIGLAIIAGTMFGFASAATKSIVHIIPNGLGDVVGAWETYALVATGLIGLTCQQLAFQAGSLEISFPAAIVLDPLVSVAVGIAALKERLHTDGLGWVLIGVSAVAMVAGTIALARAGAPTPATRTAGDTGPPLAQPAG
ncbi:MAG: DMT family transporter, partial [Acidimicrobiia bacterium]|nr:DMT family transporter [Acidimicrobiia bacterium]